MGLFVSLFVLVEENEYIDTPNCFTLDMVALALRDPSLLDIMVISALCNTLNVE